jgi:hypothetical protein
MFIQVRHFPTTHRIADDFFQLGDSSKLQEHTAVIVHIGITQAKVTIGREFRPMFLNAQEKLIALMTANSRDRMGPPSTRLRNVDHHRTWMVD